MEWIPKMMPITVDDLKKDLMEVEQKRRKGQAGLKHNAQKGNNQNTQKGNNAQKGNSAQKGNKENVANQRKQHDYKEGGKKNGQKGDWKDEPSRQRESTYAGDKSHQRPQPDIKGEDKISWGPSL